MDSAGWRVTERKVANRNTAPKKSPARPKKADLNATAPGGTMGGGGGASSSSGRAQSASPARRRNQADGADVSGGYNTARGAPTDSIMTESVPPGGQSPKADGGKPNIMKGRVIESWLNQTLGQAQSKGDGDGDAAALSKSAASTAAKQMQGLSEFGIDSAALERLGLNQEASKRVYRAMFVYSQGLHAVLQEAVGRSKNASQALLVLWRAFTAVLEHAGQSEQQGADSLAALVQRGNEEERARMEDQYRDELSAVQGQLGKFTSERRTLQDEIQRLREEEVRYFNDSEMYRTEHLVAVAKYEREIKARVDAEVRFLEKTRWADALQEDLDKERKQHMQVAALLAEANGAQEAAQVDLDRLQIQVKTQEAQAGAYKQNALEAAQQRQRHEQQVAQYKQNIDRMNLKMTELKEQLEQEAEAAKKLTEQAINHQREVRKLETQYEDEAHGRKELQNERDLLREKIDRLDRELVQLTEERRGMQKEINDLSMTHRTSQIELKRKAEQLERTEKQYDKLQVSHRDLLDTHRALAVEAENLREDVTHLDEQLKKESGLRKQLQAEKKLLNGQLQTLQIERDTQALAVQGTQKELKEVTEKMVKLESILRDTKTAMQKQSLEHQVELKAQAAKVQMLEKVVADERKERRNLVAETQEVVEKREESLGKLKARTQEVQELKRQRLEKEEEVDRLKVLLKAQEQRNSEQLVTVDKYQAAVASHDAETRQMQVLLECEREEAKRQLKEMQNVHEAARHTLERRIEHWKMCFEDVFSRINFNPATEKLHELEIVVTQLTRELADAKEEMLLQEEHFKNAEQLISQRDARIDALEKDLEVVQEERAKAMKLHQRASYEVEKQSMARNDAEHQCQRIQTNRQEFDQMKAALEAKLVEANAETERLNVIITKESADAETQVIVEVESIEMQTDLSYQYLEHSDHLQHDRWRRERLHVLKQASNFVADGEEHRDFTLGLGGNITPGPVIKPAKTIGDIIKKTREAEDGVPQLRLDVGGGGHTGGIARVEPPREVHGKTSALSKGINPPSVLRTAADIDPTKGLTGGAVPRRTAGGSSLNNTAQAPDGSFGARGPPSGRPPHGAQVAQAARSGANTQTTFTPSPWSTGNVRTGLVR